MDAWPERVSIPQGGRAHRRGRGGESFAVPGVKSAEFPCNHMSDSSSDDRSRWVNPAAKGGGGGKGLITQGGGKGLLGAPKVNGTLPPPPWWPPPPLLEPVWCNLLARFLGEARTCPACVCGGRAGGGGRGEGRGAWRLRRRRMIDGRRRFTIMLRPQSQGHSAAVPSMATSLAAEPVQVRSTIRSAACGAAKREGVWLGAMDELRGRPTSPPLEHFSPLWPILANIGHAALSSVGRNLRV